jgi:hypothetical protein
VKATAVGELETVDGFEPPDGGRGARWAASSANSKRWTNLVGSSFCCHAVYILVPGSFFATYSTTSAIAVVTLSTADALI